MTKAALDSDIYADIYGDEETELPLDKSELSQQGDISGEVEVDAQASSSSIEVYESTTNAGTLNQVTYRSLPAKPAGPSSAQLSYSAQIAKQFSAYQQTPSQERQQQNTRSGQSRSVSAPSENQTVPGTSSNTVFGKKPSEMHDSGKMFIGGLNWDTTDEGLRDYFSQFGKVDACTIMRDPSGTSRGFAFLTFEDATSVNTVLTREHVLDGKPIDPKRAIPREEHLRNTRYFVGGLSPSTTSDSMREFFGAYGKVVDATVMVDRESGRSKGFGFVTFEDASNLDQLVGKIGLTLDDKQIEVKAAQPRSQRDQTRTAAVIHPTPTTALETYDQRMATSNMNFLPANQQNPMAMLYQRSMVQNPLAMMNMNPMMGMGMMGMNGFNAMNNMGGGIPAMNMMGTSLNGLANGMTNGIGSGMGNVNPMRFGVGPIANLGIGNQNFMGGGGGQTGGIQVRNPGMGIRQITGGVGLNHGRISGNSGPGPTRMTARGQHGFHPYAR